MSVEAEQLDEWIGAEVVDPEGEKLGKVAEVYYRGNDPLVIDTASPSHLYAGTFRGVFKTTAGGTKWQQAADMLLDQLEVPGGAEAQLGGQDLTEAGVTVRRLTSRIRIEFIANSVNRGFSSM